MYSPLWGSETFLTLSQSVLNVWVFFTGFSSANQVSRQHNHSRNVFKQSVWVYRVVRLYVFLRIRLRLNFRLMKFCDLFFSSQILVNKWYFLDQILISEAQIYEHISFYLFTDLMYLCMYLFCESLTIYLWISGYFCGIIYLQIMQEKAPISLTPC